ncbi:Putative aromatic amino acid lyase, L-Aspartase, fumarase/histidase [Colletotrichum destructivum]|uniref:Aromatic amino acid lyase, L-Aspartase, fumarase/histidase n=1 Tax=Colletotrichum destructivum TaxID=34406 RepID=A0AAX4J457_9PEZI|nr:Putative aromatic amino acid lyase, L-Aspartase, fumarase/histidase [Colletotrichum destructivum]
MFTRLVLSQRHDPSSSTEAPLLVNGGDLTIAGVVAVSRHLAPIELTSASINAIEACSKIIPEKIDKGDVIYGVNTGFGGSADARSNDVERVQQSLISHLTCGIVSDARQKKLALTNKAYSRQNPTTNGHSSHSNGEEAAHPATNGKTCNGTKRQWFSGESRSALPLNDPLAATCMPESWARASMLVRLNSLAGGASGIRVDIAESLKNLLNKDVVPRIPVRGSISASGDLSALAWIGALMQGKTCATAFSGPRNVEGTAARRVMRADLALSEAGIAPVSLHAKEGLAIVNGTSVSAGVAALAAYESLNLAALSQVLTAMSVEALRGSDESFEPFIARIRPHPGQVDSARNIKAFLNGSRLLNRHDSRDAATLRQDRYSLRTASQWIGPVLEDFCLAYQQLTVELNSVTDNPLIDVETGRVFHGGNFQARAVTSAVEKLRQGLQTIGRMLFTQCTEMINPATSWGLPPNLCSEDPNDSFLFKGLDVVIAALTSELGFLANPVGSHVQTAEMGNQSLNSLALVSARYTLDAVDVLSQIASAHLLAVCQALDLRAREMEGAGRDDDDDDAAPDATPYIGQASRRMYRFIRHDLGVPFLGEEHLASTDPVVVDGVSPSMGLYNTRVYESIRSGRLYEVVLDCLEEVEEQRNVNGSHA